jgi:hypothetical protein
MVAIGPEIICVTSITRKPLSGPAMMVSSDIAALHERARRRKTPRSYQQAGTHGLAMRN